MQILEIQYVYGLVAASVLISMVASYVAFTLAERMRTARNPLRRRGWLLGGSIAMGIGVWSMHYLGMLAIKLPVEVDYYLPTVLLSLLLAIAASATVLLVVSADRQGPLDLILGGLLMGAGIGGMHYTGMAAMRSSAMHHYNPLMIGVSILTAVGFSWMALRLGFVLRDSELHRIGAGMLMGLGIASMHYVAMAGVTFVPAGMTFSTEGTVRVGTLGEAAVAITTLLVLAVALGTATLDKVRFHRLSVERDSLAAAQTALLQSQQQLQEANALLSELSIRDGLTGLFNRRHFDAILGTEWRRAVRGRNPLSLLMIDVDHFKRLNDNFGHQRGDDCLREIARILEDLPRRGYDISSRYGGEEFAVLLPEADAHGALKVAEAIRQAVEDLRIETIGSPCGPWVTVSIGVCSRHPIPTHEPEAMLHDADTALYGAEQLGRNRVEIATEIPISA